MELRLIHGITFRELRQRWRGASSSAVNQRRGDLAAAGLLDRNDGTASLFRFVAVSRTDTARVEEN